MRRILVDPLTPDASAIVDAAAVLLSGGVVAYPTDTLYGLAVDPRNPAAVARLFDLKGRNAASAIALIAADAALAEHAGRFGTVERRLAAKFWPGPLTIVVPAADSLVAALAPGGTLGVRVPAHPTACAISQALQECITATSANRSGEPPATSADQIAAALGDDVDVLIDGGPAPGGAPSTIVEVVDGRLVLHRPGAVSWDRVLESVE